MAPSQSIIRLINDLVSEQKDADTTQYKKKHEQKHDWLKLMEATEKT